MEFECPECKKKFYSEEALQQHANAKHAAPQAQGQKAGRKIKTSYIVPVAVIIIIAVIAYLATGAAPTSYQPRTPDGENFLGNESAAVTMTEFSDFQCPFCARFFRDTGPQIKGEYIDTGKVKFIYKHFPIASHSNAQKAAEAAECAADIGGQDAFWLLHDKMFQNNNLLSMSNLKRFAHDTGLNGTEFDACLDSGTMRQRVVKDQEEGPGLA